MIGAKVVARRKIASCAIKLVTLGPFGLKNAVLRTTASAALVSADIPVCRLLKPFNRRSFRGWLHGIAFGGMFVAGIFGLCQI
jgi:hypothetical protein